MSIQAIEMGIQIPSCLSRKKEVENRRIEK